MMTTITNFPIVGGEPLVNLQILEHETKETEDENEEDELTY